MHIISSDRSADDRPPSSLPTLLAVLVAAIVGVALGLVALPIVTPQLSRTLIGPHAQGYWFLSRASALVSYVLLWLSMIFGLLITSRSARLWPGGPAAFDLHQHTSLLGLAFAAFHALILLGDRYIGYSLGEILVPFAAIDYRPVWIGAGQLAIYGLLIVTVSFYLRSRIGRAWRLIHGASFVLFGLALLHGIASGTDSHAAWIGALYWISGGSLLFLLLYRLLVAKPGARGVASAARRQT